MNADPGDEFYVGYLPEAPSRIARFVRKSVVALFLLLAVFGFFIAFLQETIEVSHFEFTEKRNFEGILQKDPVPHLVLERPGKMGEAEALSRYYLVQPFKFGFPPELCGEFDGHKVAVVGKLIYREDQTMIEAIPSSLLSLGSSSVRDPAATDLKTRVERLGRYTLVGEIVDSKCYLGVMNPGHLKAHRACAIRCISGGIPPMLSVRHSDGGTLYFLLVAADGSIVNREVLDFVAMPVEITGEVVRYDSLLVLKADPATYQTLF